MVLGSDDFVLLSRFGVLWRFRYQVWPRMEEGANAYFKVVRYLFCLVI